MVVKNKRLRRSGHNILREAYATGRYKSRSDLKTAGVDHKFISSERSYELHSKNWDRFVDWTEAHGYSIKRLNKLTDDVIEQYIRYEAENGGRYGGGAAKATLQSYITAINKVGLASNLITEKDKVTLTNLEKKAPVSYNPKSKYGIYKNETGSEWISQNSTTFKSYNELISTVQAFGLRRREVKELNTSSFIFDQKSKKMFVQTIGKGGKYRIAECTEQKNAEMTDLYKDIATPVVDVRSFKFNNDYLKRRIEDLGLRLNIKGNNSQGVPLHIFRSDYAQTLLQEKFKYFNQFTHYRRGYSGIDLKTSNMQDLSRINTKIESFEGSALAFYIVSRNLGHNRLDVLKKYLRY